MQKFMDPEEIITVNLTRSSAVAMRSSDVP